MSYKASSTKGRFDELHKNPLIFCRLGSVNVQDEKGFYHSMMATFRYMETDNI